MPVSVYCWSDWPLSCVRVTLSSPVSYFVSFSDSFLDPPGKPAQKFGKYFVKNWDTDDNILFFQALWLGCNISPPPPIFAFPHKHNLHSQQNKVNLGRVDHPDPGCRDQNCIRKILSLMPRVSLTVAVSTQETFPQWRLDSRLGGKEGIQPMCCWTRGKEIFASYGP